MSAAGFMPRALILALSLGLGTSACAGGRSDVRSNASADCELSLLVQFSPSITRPNDNEALQTLVQGSGAALRYVRSLGPTTVLRLSGPAGSCEAGLDLLRRQPGVRSVELDERQRPQSGVSREPAARGSAG